MKYFVVLTTYKKKEKLQMFLNPAAWQLHLSCEATQLSSLLLLPSCCQHGKCHRAAAAAALHVLIFTRHQSLNGDWQRWQEASTLDHLKT